MKTFAYARLSIENDKSVSIDDQIKKIEAYALATDRVLEQPPFVDHGVSGKTMDRPELQKLLATIAPGDTIIVAKLDRLTRSVGDMARLLDLKINIVSVAEALDTSSAAGRMVVNILGVFAQFERETIVERTTASLAFRRENKQSYGHCPYGYQAVNGNLYEDVSEQPTLVAIRRMRAQGKGYTWIADSLNRNGVPCRGKKWYASTVSAILKSKMEQEAVG